MYAIAVGVRALTNRFGERAQASLNVVAGVVLFHRRTTCHARRVSIRQKESVQGGQSGNSFRFDLVIYRVADFLDDSKHAIPASCLGVALKKDPIFPVAVLATVPLTLVCGPLNR